MTVLAFHEYFKFEAYLYEKDGGSNDDFLNHVREWQDDEIEYQPLTDAGFAELKTHRIPGSANEIYKNKEKNGKYWRSIIMRYVPEGSTAESRQEGLSILEGFLKDERFSRHPPTKLELRDITDEEDPHALDSFFMDEDIEKFMNIYLDADLFGKDFFEEYDDFSVKCWKGPHKSGFASRLGFPASP